MPRLLKKTEAATLLRNSSRTLDRFRRLGVLNSTKMGNAVMFTEDDLVEFVRRSRD